MESIPSIVPIPVPFCNLGSKDEIKYSDAETKPSLSSGFGAKFEKPESGGGTYVTRQQMNGILHLATAGECARQNGAINTFNPDLVATTGGYAEGAVLDVLVGGTVRKVRSLHNNNTFDFTKSGVNGIDWEYCDAAAGAMKIFPSLTDAQTLCDGYITIPSSGKGRISEIYKLTEGADYFVSFGIVAGITSASDGLDIDFAIRNKAASGSTEDWVSIQSGMWTTSGSVQIGQAFGSLYLHGGSELAVVVPATSPAIPSGSKVWLTLKAFPLTF